jgi:predicted enzyme related to lactoylglutathione lyase
VSDHRVKGIAFGSIYVDDYKAAYRFYSETLGLDKLYDMGDAACFFGLADDTGLYLQGGNTPASCQPESIRAAFVFAVESASATYERLRSAGARFVHDEPRHMGGDNYWFQFYDPAGNILEALGPE